jgi:RHS repeat-associated protein
LTGINYKKNSSLLGNLIYQYDLLGRRSSVSGGFSRLDHSQPVSSSTYNAANQQLAFGAQNLSYDSNGNLTSDGANTYVWDSRNRLASITGPSTNAAFQYDPFGRRTRKTVNGVTTDFLYDGPNVVQESSGGSPAANLLTSLSVDEVFIRTDSGGARTFLVDGLGSTLALLDSAGNTLTEYTYDPFGRASTSGSAGANPYQFTGRENDGAGLYYYRSRYYSPNLQRFISEDPIGVAGGLNVFAYVNNSPTNFRDPSGLILDTIIDIISIGYDIYRLATDGRKNLAENLTSLGLDLAGALIPFATGLGAANRAVNHADDVMRFADDAADAARGLCFLAGTKVATDRGDTAIETLSAGDRIVSADPLKGNSAIRSVTRTFARTATTVLDITIGSTTITCTPEHPFWVEGVGWLAAEQLEAGSPLRTRQGTIVQVTSVTRREGSFAVYNIEVSGMHTYFVSELGVLVHNQCQQMTPDQRALKDLVDEVTNGGRKPLSVDDANTVLDWADEVQYPGARAKPGDVSSPSNWTGHPNQPPHIHLPGAGRGGHVPVQPGVQPRP